VDEYGGTAGMLTMDDILNELMGRVPGRRAGESGIEVGENGLVRVSGRVSLRLLNRELAHPIEDPGGADTVGGYIAALLGRLPRPGDTVWDAHYQYRVIRMAGRRVDAVELRPAPSSETSDAPKAPETVDSCS
jgi:CBS domain containing-hemolysin-like protein